MNQPQKHKLPERWYRDVWLFIITLMVLGALLTITDTVNEVQEGRRAATGISCAVSSATVTAGHDVIVSSAEQAMPPKLEKFLMHLGVPGHKTRESEAKLLAKTYANSIESAVIAAAGAQAKQVVNKDGTLNCNKLRELARIK
jgi:hypothetical protein